MFGIQGKNAPAAWSCLLFLFTDRTKLLHITLGFFLTRNIGNSRRWFPFTNLYKPILQVGAFLGRECDHTGKPSQRCRDFIQLFFISKSLFSPKVIGAESTLRRNHRINVSYKINSLVAKMQIKNQITMPSITCVNLVSLVGVDDHCRFIE